MDFMNFSAHAKKLSLVCAAGLCAAFATQAQAAPKLQITCSDKTVTVTVLEWDDKSKYVGVTATLADKTYYDFPALEIGSGDIGKVIVNEVPADLPEVDHFTSTTWTGKKDTSQPWSPDVRNHQGYVMTGRPTENVRCR